VICQSGDEEICSAQCLKKYATGSMRANQVSSLTSSLSSSSPLLVRPSRSLASLALRTPILLGLALAVATAGMATTATTTTKKTRRGAQRVGWLLREATIPVSSPHGGNSSSRTRPGMAPPRRATRGGWESREYGRCLPTAGNGRRLASLPAVFETWSVLCQKTKAVSPW